MHENDLEIENVYLRSVIIGVIFVLILIIIWLVLDIVRFTRRDRDTKEPEDKPKTKISENGVSDFDIRITEV